MKLKRKIISVLNKLPYVRGLYQQNLDLRKTPASPRGITIQQLSPLMMLRNGNLQFGGSENTDGIIGINLQTENQLGLLNCFRQYYKEMPFTGQKQTNLRYGFDNDFYSYSDGIILYSMIRHFKPKQIIEIGSGFSSAAMLDINELFFDTGIRLTFIEPYPGRLYSLIHPDDKKIVTIIEKRCATSSIRSFLKS